MPPKTELPKKSNPSLAYEVLIYLNSFYFGMFACCELGMGLLKAINLSYEMNPLIRDSGVLVALCVLESLRCIMGRRGRLINKGLVDIQVKYMCNLTVIASRLARGDIHILNHPVFRRNLLSTFVSNLQTKTRILFMYPYVVLILY